MDAITETAWAISNGLMDTTHTAHLAQHLIVCARVAHSVTLSRSACCAVTDGSAAQIESVFEAGLFPPLISLVPRSSPAVQRAVGFVLLNVIECPHPSHIQWLGELDAIPALCSMLQPDSPHTSRDVALDFLNGMMRCSKAASPDLHRAFLEQIDKCNGRAAMHDTLDH